MPEMELTVKLRWHFEPGDDTYPEELTAEECLEVERRNVDGEAPSVGIVEYISLVSDSAELAWRIDVVPEGGLVTI